jgi:hypothetical protein
MPGALHNVMVRGINRTTIFEDGQDKIRFLEQLGKDVTTGRQHDQTLQPVLP